MARGNPFHLDPNYPICSIRLGVRARVDYGDLDGLQESICENGLLQPIVVDAHGLLIAGGRRLEACRRLGWTAIPAHVVPASAGAVLLEAIENGQRKNFTPTEAVRLGRSLEQFLASRPGQGPIRDRVATCLGLSGRSYEKARALVEAAEAEPDRFGWLLGELDATGKIDPTFRRFRRLKGDDAKRPRHHGVSAGEGPRLKEVDAGWVLTLTDDWANEIAAVLADSKRFENALRKGILLKMEATE